MSSIRKKISSGIFYIALSKYSSIVVSIIIGAVLARLLTPAEYGMVAIVSVFLAFFNLLSNFGLAPAIVQNKTLTKDEISSIFSFSILFGLILAIIFYLLAPLIASFYNDNTLINIARLMSFAIIFQSLTAVPYALNIKKLKFKQVGIIKLVVHVISGSVAIILAYKGFSYYALVINSILSGLLTFAFFYFLEPIKISFIIRVKALKKIAQFSTYQFLFQFINYFAINADNFLVGKIFGDSALGFYSKAYQLMTMPVKNLTFVITPVLQPILSEYQNEKKVIYNLYYKMVKLLALIGFPLSVFLFFSGSEIITILYGSQWGQSIPIFKLLALTIGFHIVLSTSGSIFQALNRTDLLFYAGLIGSILTVLGISYGIFIGKTLVSIGYGLIIATIFNFFQAFYLLINRALYFSVLKFLKILIYPITISIAIAISLLFLSYFEIDNLLLSLTLKMTTTVLMFGIIISSSKEHRELLNEYIVKKIRRKK